MCYFRGRALKSRGDPKKMGARGNCLIRLIQYPFLDVLKAINKLSGKITSFENKFSILESRNVTHIGSISTKIETTFNAKFEKLDEKK